MRLLVVTLASCALALAAPGCDSGSSDDGTGTNSGGTGGGTGSGTGDTGGSGGGTGTDDGSGGGTTDDGSTDTGGGTGAGTGTGGGSTDNTTCAGRECGLNAAGESCGLCDGGKACENGTCVKDPSCNPGETCCAYPWEDQVDGKGIGEGCTSDAECAFGKCLLPLEGGNITNNVFGFCTRACDCGSEASKLTDAEKTTSICLYSPGNQGSWRHAVLKCTNLADCQAVDPRWDDCGTPYGTAKVCLAGDL